MTDLNRPTEAELADQLANAPEAPGAENGDDGGGQGRRRREIFDDCPVTPLGVNGDFAYFLDVNGQMRRSKEIKVQFLQSIFGHQINKLRWNFPIWINTAEKGDPAVWDRDPKKIDHAFASMVLWEAASECGVFNPDNSVRGVGAWADDDGALVYHMGDKVLHQGELRAPGRIDGRIYPAASPILHPAMGDSFADPAPPIREALESWNWTQPALHTQAALGLLGVQMLGGALDWRPVFWLLAPAASGKSEFQKLLRYLHGDDGLVQSTDATKSGITSQLGHSSRPVAVDELEPGDERSTKERDIIMLARVAASGGQWFRGSADQSGVGGKVYSAFLFSSILIPGVMKSQDVQRLIRLEMNPLQKGAKGLGLDPRTWRARGARLKALLIRRWPGWPERLAQWRHSLEAAGVTGRDADNWATVMAMADMAEADDVAPEDARANWAKKVAFQVNADRSDTTNDAEAMLLRLMSQVFDPWRKGQRYTIAQWVMAAAGLPAAPDGLKQQLYSGDDKGNYEKRERQKIANQMLASVGLRVYDDKQHGARLFIMNKPVQGLRELFHGSDWADGVWQQSAKRVPEAMPSDSANTLAGITSRGVYMPLKSIPGLLSLPMDHAREDGAPPPSDDLEDFK